VIKYVIDASAAVEYLLRTTLGLKVAEVIADGFLVAPALLDVEVLAVLRRAVLRKKLAEQRAAEALADLIDWQVDRIAHPPLIQEAWRHRYNVSGYDAFYVAVARLYNIPLLTADGPLARAPTLTISVRNMRLE
jgi:predicted nucleic acid-binding protein